MHKRLTFSPGTLTNFSLLAFLFLSTVVPWADLYRLFFFAGVMPGVLWSLKRHGVSPQFRTAGPVLLVILVAFLAMNSFIVSEAGLKERFDQFRWGIEILFLLAAVLIAGVYWLSQPRIYGLIFLWAAVIAGLSALVPYLWTGDFSVRLTGVGFLQHPIQAASILLVLWTIGTALLNLSKNANWPDRFLVVSSALIITVVALLSQSRGPVIAVILTLLFCVTAQGVYQSRSRILALLGLGVGLILVGALLIWTLETPGSWLYDVMTRRGLSYRPEIWSTLLAHCQSFWLMGVGPATEFVDTVPGTLLQQETGAVFLHSHNLFLQIFLVGGVVALAIFVSAIVAMMLQLVRYTGVLRRRVALMGHGILIVLFMVNFTDTAHLLSSPKPDWVLLWLPLAVICLLSVETSAHMSSRLAVGEDK